VNDELIGDCTSSSNRGGSCTCPVLDIPSRINDIVPCVQTTAWMLMHVAIAKKQKRTRRASTADHADCEGDHKLVRPRTQDAMQCLYSKPYQFSFITPL
jgi:hypothetical protein